MTNVHSARFLRYTHERNGSVQSQSGAPDDESMTDCATAKERNSVTVGFVTCHFCGALVAPDIDCEAEDCPGSPDQRLFAIYMQPGRTYRLSNWLDRYNIRGTIEEALRRATDYRALVCRLHRHGTLTDAEAITRENLETIKLHANALARMDELDEQAHAREARR